MTKLRGIVVGAGYFAQFHLEAWQRGAGAEIVALCDHDQQRAGSIAQRWGIASVFETLAAALDNVEADFVDIVTPPATHLELVAQSAAAGKAIICQKPVAPTLAEARQVVAAARGVPMMIHENFRFQPWHRELKRLIQQGAIGQRLHRITMQTRLGDGWGPEAYLARQPYFRTMPRLLLHETGVHFVDTFRYLGGEISEVYAVLQRLNDGIAGEDAGLVTFRFANGGVGLWDANRYNDATAANPRLTFGRMTIDGDRGTLRLYDDGRLTRQTLGETEVPHEYEWSDRGFAGDCVHATQQHFVDCLRQGCDFETPGSDYLHSLDIVEAAYRSHVANRPQNLGTAADWIDLTRPIDNALPGAEIVVARTIADHGWNATTLTLYSHCGTHIDAPCHFVPDAETLDDLDLARCQGPAWVIDLTPVEPSAQITLDDLGGWQQRLGNGDRVLLRTDWHKRFPDSSYRECLPRLSVELAEWLVARGVALVGVEPPSVADVNNLHEVTQIHHILLRGGVTIVEGLVQLDQLPSRVELIVAPLRIRGGDGSPVRALARPLREHVVQ